MSGFNQAILLGRLGNDPEVKYLQSGTAVAQLSLATSRKKKDDAGEVQEVTQWHRVKFFGKQAEVIGEYAKKGDLFFVEGRIEYWEAKSDRGGKLWVADVIGEHFEFAGRSNRGGDDRPAGAPGASSAREQARRAVHGGGDAPAAAPGAASGQQVPFEPFEPFDDDIPF